MLLFILILSGIGSSILLILIYGLMSVGRKADEAEERIIGTITREESASDTVRLLYDAQVAREQEKSVPININSLSELDPE
jgi:hypothetical protein